jgi:hypothetical protein
VPEGERRDGGVAVRARAAAQVFVDDPAAPVLSTPDAHHLARVLRLEPGEEVVAADGRGHWCRCAFRGASARDVPEEARLEPLEPVAFEPARLDRPQADRARDRPHRRPGH